MILALAAGCAGTASLTPVAIPTSTPVPTTTEAATPAPIRTPAPVPTDPPTIGLPADDGARIIAVESPSLNGPDPVTRARDLTIDSPAVSRSFGLVHVRLLLPSGFGAQPATRWPVLYLLHGGGGKYSDWTDLFDVEALTAPTNLLVVMPDAEVGWYSDWWNGGKGGSPAWETFHLIELRQLIERNWHAGDKRAIAGMSMGGYGAMEYASRQPGMFRIAGSFSGPLDPLCDGAWLGQYVDRHAWGDPVAQADVWKAHDPTTNAERLKGTALFVAFGNGEVGPLDNGQPSPWDPVGETEREIGLQGAAFVHRLAQLKIPVTVYDYGNGTHFEPYFSRDLHRSLPLILKALGE